MEDQLDALRSLCASLSRQIEQKDATVAVMADRLIEMAMTQQGDNRMAVAHRQQGRIETVDGAGHNSFPLAEDGWPSQEPQTEDEWPPPGHTEMKV